MTGQTPVKYFRFDPTINLGHVASLIAAVLMVLASWISLDKRVVVLEEARKAQEVMDRVQDQRANEARTEIKETLVEVKRSIDRMNDKLDAGRGKP